MEQIGLLEWLLPTGLDMGNQPDNDAVKGIRNKVDLITYIRSVLQPYLTSISILIGIADAEGTITHWWVDTDRGFQFTDLPRKISRQYLSGADPFVLHINAPDRSDAFQTCLYKGGVKEALVLPLQYNLRHIGVLCLVEDAYAFSAALQAMLRSSAKLLVRACLQAVLFTLLEENRQKGQPLLADTGGMIGGAALQGALQLVAQVAPTDATVLLTGETGTGKELFAKAVHNGSPRKGSQMIKVNCAALPPQLIESELFGHERGAFTGALQRRIGKFEQADNSTLFLDEVGELPLELQAKLLRVLQEKEIERLGGNTTIPVDVRIVAATNRVLEEEVAAGRFREDLYYRLLVFPIALPPLRERKEDIPLLLRHFTARAAEKYQKQVQGIDPRCIGPLVNYSWPGNIRELENMVERAVIAAMTPLIHITPPVSRQWAATDTSPPVQTLAEAERAAIIRALRHCNGRIRGPLGAAELLDIKPTTLEARMKKLGIVKEHVIR